jgi:hypothetical protein
MKDMKSSDRCESSERRQEEGTAAADDADERGQQQRL